LTLQICPSMLEHARPAVIAHLKALSLGAATS
jgi:hypothetical protein